MMKMAGSNSYGSHGRPEVPESPSAVEFACALNDVRMSLSGGASLEFLTLELHILNEKHNVYVHIPKRQSR